VPAAAAIPRDADRAVRNALADLLEHLAYEREVDPGDDYTEPLEGDVADVLGGGELLLLDLHGQRAAAAKDRMRSVHEPLAAVYFGKGSGVLRDVFHEVFSSTDDYLLVGLSGETEDRPQPSLGLLVRADAHAALVKALGAAPEKKKRPAAAAEKPAAEKKPPAERKSRKKKEPSAPPAPAAPRNPAAWLVLGAVALGVAWVFPPVLVVYLAVAIWYFEGRRRS
jgi:hypothetical protein